jgi:hypothetical protein
VETEDAEIGERLLGLTGAEFAHAHTFPLMSGGAIHGAMVLFCRSLAVIDPERIQLAEGIPFALTTRRPRSRPSCSDASSAT